MNKCDLKLQDMMIVFISIQKIKYLGMSVKDVFYKIYMRKIKEQYEQMNKTREVLNLFIVFIFIFYCCSSKTRELNI